MRPLYRVLLLFGLSFAALALTAGLVAQAEISPADWWNEGWRYRVPLQVGANGAARTDKPAEVSLNFTSLLSALGTSGTLDLGSLRLLEVDAGGAVLDESVPFQFDQAAGFNAATNASGTLVFLLEGATASGATRRYHLYFDTTARGPFTPLSFTPQVTVTSVSNYQGQDSFKIETANHATYYYHKQGAGFASMLDVQSNDWISYNTGAESSGEYRGIPNMGAWAHPGYTNASSGLTSSGPLKAVITSTSTGRSLTWSFYPKYATMKLLAAGENYWFLYEGTPFGGAGVDPNRDYYVLSNGQKTYVRTDQNKTLTTDIAVPEWLYFGDDNTTRVLFLAHHEDDAEPDYFRMQDNVGAMDGVGGMTVFGFGRQDPCCTRYLSEVPAHFTLGFATTASVTSTLNSAYTALSTSTGQPQALNRSPVLGALTDKSAFVGQALTFNVSATDADGASPDLSAAPLPTGANFTDNGNGTGQFSWTPDGGDIGAHLVTFTATDGELDDSHLITITVSATQPKVYLPVIIAAP